MGRRGRFDGAEHAVLAGRQFDAIATLIRSRGPTRQAARLVMVEGMRQCDAARRVGISGQSLSQTLTSFQKAMALVRIAVEPSTEAEHPPLWIIGSIDTGGL